MPDLVIACGDLCPTVTHRGNRTAGAAQNWRLDLVVAKVWIGHFLTSLQYVPGAEISCSA